MNIQKLDIFETEIERKKLTDFQRSLFYVRFPHSQSLDLRRYRKLQRLAGDIDSFVYTLTAATNVVVSRFLNDQQVHIVNHYHLTLSDQQYFEITLKIGSYKIQYRVDFDSLLESSNPFQYLANSIQDYVNFITEEIDNNQNIFYLVPTDQSVLSASESFD